MIHLNAELNYTIYQILSYFFLVLLQLECKMLLQAVSLNTWSQWVDCLGR